MGGTLIDLPKTAECYGSAVQSCFDFKNLCASNSHNSAVMYSFRHSGDRLYSLGYILNALLF